MNENKINFEEFLKDCISAGNNIIKSFFDIKITNKDADEPEIVIDVTENKDELQILLVFLGFAVSANEVLEKFIIEVVKDNEIASFCTQTVLQIIATAHAVCEERLKLLKETKGETN